MSEKNSPLVGEDAVNFFNAQARRGAISSIEESVLRMRLGISVPLDEPLGSKIDHIANRAEARDAAQRLDLVTQHVVDGRQAAINRMRYGPGGGRPR